MEVVVALIGMIVVAVGALVVAAWAIHLAFRPDQKDDRDPTIKDAVSSFGFHPQDYDQDDDWVPDPPGSR